MLFSTITTAKKGGERNMSKKWFTKHNLSLYKLEHVLLLSTVQQKSNKIILDQLSWVRRLRGVILEGEEIEGGYSDQVRRLC